MKTTIWVILLTALIAGMVGCSGPQTLAQPDQPFHEMAYEVPEADRSLDEIALPEIHTIESVDGARYLAITNMDASRFEAWIEQADYNADLANGHAESVIGLKKEVNRCIDMGRETEDLVSTLVDQVNEERKLRAQSDMIMTVTLSVGLMLLLGGG